MQKKKPSFIRNLIGKRRFGDKISHHFAKSSLHFVYEKERTRTIKENLTLIKNDYGKSNQGQHTIIKKLTTSQIFFTIDLASQKGASEWLTLLALIRDKFANVLQ